MLTAGRGGPRGLQQPAAQKLPEQAKGVDPGTGQQIDSQVKHGGRCPPRYRSGGLWASEPGPAHSGPGDPQEAGPPAVFPLRRRSVTPAAGAPWCHLALSRDRPLSSSRPSGDSDVQTPRALAS